MLNWKWFPLIGLSGILLLCAFLCQKIQEITPSQIMSFYIEGEAENIRIWEDEEKTQYVFLPSYVELDQVHVCLATQTEIRLDGRLLSESMTCADYEVDKYYTLQYSSRGQMTKTQLMFLKSLNMPSLFLDTESGKMDYIHLKKGNGESGGIRLYSADGELNYSGTIMELNGRGNTTWTEYDKKPYSLTLKEDTSLLDMPAAQEWILLANADDPSHLRNKLVFDFAKEIGLENSPEAHWVDLYLNGQYAGLYLLCERNELHPNRIRQTDESGYLVSMESEWRLKEQSYPYIKTKSGIALRIREQGNIDEARLEELYNRWQTVEDALLASDSLSSQPAWLDIIDIDSWVRKYLIEEVLGNTDGCRISQFFYSPSIDDRIYAGPVWDYDHAVGTTSIWQCVHANTLFAVQKDPCGDVGQAWFSSLYQSKVFYEAIVDVYRNVFLPQLTLLLDSRLEEYVRRIDSAVRVDWLRWQKKADETQPNPSIRIRDYLEEKRGFLNDLWLEGKAYVRVKADPGNGNYYAYYYLEKGQPLTQLPELIDYEWAEFTGWYYADTGEPFDRLRPVYEDMVVVGSWKTSNSHRMSQLVRLLPLGMIILIGGILLIVEVKRHWRYR